MKSRLAFVLFFLSIVRYINGCSVGVCKPGTQRCIIGNGGSDCRGVLGCLKTCPSGSSHIGPLVPSKFAVKYFYNRNMTR